MYRDCEAGVGMGVEGGGLWKGAGVGWAKSEKKKRIRMDGLDGSKQANYFIAFELHKKLEPKLDVRIKYTIPIPAPTSFPVQI